MLKAVSPKLKGPVADCDHFDMQAKYILTEVIGLQAVIVLLQIGCCWDVPAELGCEQAAALLLP
mgnify:CR=1 FL=1